MEGCVYWEVKIDVEGLFIGVVLLFVFCIIIGGFVVGGMNYIWVLNIINGKIYYDGVEFNYMFVFVVGMIVGVLFDKNVGIFSFMIGNFVVGIVFIGLNLYNEVYFIIVGVIFFNV